MITSLIEMLELQNFDRMATSTILSHEIKFCLRRHGQEL